MDNIIAILIIAAIIAAASVYIVRAKKKGVKCIGCPNGGKCGSCQGCHSESTGDDNHS